MIGIIRFVFPPHDFPRPWRISQKPSPILLVPPARDATVIAAGGKTVAVLPPLLALGLVVMSTHDESYSGLSDTYETLHRALLVYLVERFDPRRWTVRPIHPSDTSCMLIGAADDAFVVEGEVKGDATRIGMLFFPTQAIAERFCEEGERVRLIHNLSR